MSADPSAAVFDAIFDTWGQCDTQRTTAIADAALAALGQAGYRIVKQRKVDAVYDDPRYGTTVWVGDAEHLFHETTLWVDVSDTES